MIKYLGWLSTFFLFISCQNNRPTELVKFELLQNDTSFECMCIEDVELLDVKDTVLSEGYYLRYYYDYLVKDTLCLQVVDLMNGFEKIANINSLDYRMKKGSLGWLEYDYQENFIFILRGVK